MEKLTRRSSGCGRRSGCNKRPWDVEDDEDSEWLPVREMGRKFGFGV